MHKAVFCIAKNLQMAEQIVDQLRAAVFPNDAISVLCGNADTTSPQSIREHDEKVSRKKNDAHEKHDRQHGTAAGIMDGTLGLLTGIDTLSIPGMGPFIAAGPIMTSLAGTAGGNSGGLLTGSLVGLGIPEYDAVHYAEKLKDWYNILLSVHTSSTHDIDRAKEIFKKNGATDIACIYEAVGAHGRR